MIDDPSFEGSLNNKTHNEAFTLIDIMVDHKYQMPSKRFMPRKGMVELDTMNTLLAQNNSIA